MAERAPQLQDKTVSEVRNAAADFTDRLDAGEVLSGTPTIVELGTSALTLTDKKVNTSALTINGASVAIGKAVQFKAAAGMAGNTYVIRITVTTNSTPAQTLIAEVRLRVKAD